MVAAGPNTSTSCTACALPASLSLSKVGATNADLFLSMPSRVGASVPPQTIAASVAKRRMPSNAAACWPRVTSGPMRVSACRGSPILVPLSFSASASATASAFPAGTKMRRIAVHFCPAFTVISRTTSRRKASKAALPGEDSGASSAALMLSASMFTGTLLATTLGWPRTRGGVGRAGKGNDVVAGQRAKELAGAAAEEAQRAIGQHLGGDHVLHHGVPEQRGRGGGLGEDRHAGDERYRRLLPQPPAREIEGVDVDGDAAARHHQMNGLVILGLGEPHRLFVEQHARATESGVIFQRADAAVDVDGRVHL